MRPNREPRPPIPEDVTGAELDRAAKSDLKTLPKDLATEVSRYLVMAGRLVDEDPEQAYQYALVARRLAARVGVVREACGLAAYHAGLWSVALSELRAARRLTGQEEAYLAIMADAERGLGRPERALDIARSDEARRLPQAESIEMRIVESGARRDRGEYGAGVLALQVPELKDERLRPWSTRLFYAYAEALADAEREEEAADWFARAAAADRDGETDAAERYAELEGLVIIDTEIDDIEDGEISEDAGSAGAEDAGSAGAEDAGSAGAEDAGSAGAEDAGSAGAEDAGSAGDVGEIPEDSGPAGDVEAISGDAGPAGDVEDTEASDTDQSPQSPPE